MGTKRYDPILLLVETQETNRFYSFAPERSVCQFCLRNVGYGVVDSATHFTCCALHDVLWHGVAGLLEEMGFPPVIRKWFTLYGPKSIVVPRGRFCVVVWIWATMVAVMLLARSTHRDVSSQQMAPKVSLRIFRTTLATICRMDLANNPAVWLHRWYGFAELDGNNNEIKYLF